MTVVTAGCQAVVPMFVVKGNAADLTTSEDKLFDLVRLSNGGLGSTAP
jgi:hypothetical protein